MTDTGRPTDGLERRTLIKGTAWSIPVMAASVAVPARAASLPTGVDVAVTGSCSGNYRIDDLSQLVDSAAVELVQSGILKPLGFTPDPRRIFTITAAQGTIPAGTHFSLTYPSIFSSGLLSGILTAAALNVVNIDASSAEITTTASIPQGASISFDVIDAIAIASLGVASTVTLTLLDADHPAPGPGAPNSASITTLAAAAVSLDPFSSGRLSVQVCGG